MRASTRPERDGRRPAKAASAAGAAAGAAKAAKAGKANRPVVPASAGRADPARVIAHQVLRAVAERDAYANLVLPGLLRASTLPPQQRAFATELAYGALRAQGTLDLALAGSSSRPLDAVDGAVLAALRLGAYQLLQTRVPDHAAVASTVDLVAAVAGRSPVGFANAVLRSLSRRWIEAGRDLGALLSLDAGDPVGRLAGLHSHPRWIVEAFAAALGGDLAETEALLVADNARPTTHLVARELARDELLAQCRDAGLDASPAPYSPRGVRLDGGDPAALAAVADGRAAVQDEGSQLVALALAAAAPGRGTTLDSCAGPGGKAALLAAALPEARLVAVERGATRAELVRQALRWRPDALVVEGDGREPPVPPGSADRVLVDAPCSGLGALRRRPEARWRRTPEMLPELQALQGELLAAAIAATRDGGVVAYATCSPHLAETRAVVDAALARGGVVELDTRRFLPDMPHLGDGPHAQLWPHRHGTDAMFLALLRREAT